MDRLLTLTQFLFAALVFFSTLAAVVGHIATGHVGSFVGYMVAILFLALIGCLFIVSWRELRKGK